MLKKKRKKLKQKKEFELSNFYKNIIDIEI